MADITPSRPKSPASLRILRPTMRTLQAVSAEGAAFVSERLFFRAPRSRVTPGARRFLASGTRFELRVSGRRVVGWSWGSGDPVYLVHGWGGQAGRLDTVAQAIIASGHPLVVFDAPGHGHSGRGLSALPEFARTLIAASERHGPAHAIVAHSLGAAASVVALSLGMETRRIVLLAPPANPGDWARAFGAALGLRGEVLRRLRVRSEQRFRFSWDDLDICGHARTMTTPMLLVHDREDTTVPFSNGAAIARIWTGAQLVETSGLGHRGLLRDPGVISRVLEFITPIEASGRVPVPAEAGERLEHELFYRDSRWT